MGHAGRRCVQWATIHGMHTVSVVGHVPEPVNDFLNPARHLGDQVPEVLGDNTKIASAGAVLKGTVCRGCVITHTDLRVEHDMAK
jgi:hypothetical protein